MRVRASICQTPRVRHTCGCYECGLPGTMVPLRPENSGCKIEDDTYSKVKRNKYSDSGYHINPSTTSPVYVSHSESGMCVVPANSQREKKRGRTEHRALLRHAIVGADIIIRLGIPFPVQVRGMDDSPIVL